MGISIYNIQQVYAPENDISFDLVGKRRFFKITGNGTPDIFILNDNISNCEICGHSLNQKGILCNECGNVTHNKKLWKSHGFYCKNCGKSICRRCVEYYSKFLTSGPLLLFPRGLFYIYKMNKLIDNVILIEEKIIDLV